MTQLILFRALQGVGGAGLFSLAFIIIADLFPPNVRGRYQGLLGATFGIASVVGPWIGGLLTDYGSNIIPGIAGWLVTIAAGGKRAPLDGLSAVFLVLGLPRDSNSTRTISRNGDAEPARQIFLILFVLRSLVSSNDPRHEAIWGSSACRSVPPRGSLLRHGERGGSLRPERVSASSPSLSG